LISKFPAQPQSLFTAEDVAAWDRAFQAGCLRLGISRLDGLLLHAPADLRKPGGFHLASWLLGLRQRGLVQRLGVSIYSAADLEGINPILLDLVQLPLSLLDQRLLQDGTITRLRNSGTAIHARSLYLQGLLLTPSRQWPLWVNPAWRRHQQRLEALAADRGCDLIDLALGFAQAQTDLEAVVLGLCSVKELIDLQQAWSRLSPWRDGEWRTRAIQDPFILDPRLWPNS
jgi:aryl-alcohol dehydrogenase-like predicted oxidoreductase